VDGSNMSTHFSTSPVLFLLLPRLTPTPTLFPYATLFRSRIGPIGRAARDEDSALLSLLGRARFGTLASLQEQDARVRESLAALRSEEHTSELQSRENHVCRLLLENKKG